MQTQHTPGPWKRLKTFGGVIHIHTQDDKPIAFLRGYKHPYSANARLIAAAPELLDALRELCADTYLADPINADRMSKARAAIAKAERGEG